MTTTITSAPTNTAATAYSNQKHGCTLSEGTLVVVEGDTTTNAKFYYSQNSGTSWTSYGSDIAGWSNGSIASYVDTGGVERLVAVWKQSGTGGGRTDLQLYFNVGTFNAGRTTLTWGTATTVTTTVPSATVLMDMCDITVQVQGTGGKAHVVGSFTQTSAAHNQTWYSRFNIDSAGTITADVRETYISSDYTSIANVHTFPTVDIQGTTNLHVGWSAAATGAGKGIRYRLGALSAGVPTFATEVEVDNTVYVTTNTYGIICRWDGTRAVIGGTFWTGAANKVRIWDSTNFTAFTNRVDQAIANDAVMMYGPSMAVDTATGDVYLFGSPWATTYKNAGYFKATRSGTALTFGALVVTDTFTGDGSVPPYIYAWFSGATIRWVYRKGSSSPYPVVYDSLVLNVAPTIAFGASSLADGAFPTTTTPTLTAYVTDPDSSQTLTVTYEVATDSGFSSIVYTGTATAASPQTAGAVSKTTTALTKGALRYWRARVSDGSATSANTATRTFTIYDDPTVAIGASTPATTTSTGGPTLNVGWTYGQGQSLAEAFYRVQVQTNGGATTYYDSGTLAGPATSVALDAVALAIPTDTTGTALQVVVTVTAATTGTVVTATKTFDIQWGVVTVGIVSPTNGAIVATTGITAQWTFASTRSKLQGSYRIRLMIASTGSVLLDTGFVTSAATSAAVGVILVDGSTYSLEVTLKNDQGILGT